MANRSLPHDVVRTRSWVHRVLWELRARAPCQPEEGPLEDLVTLGPTLGRGRGVNRRGREALPVKVKRIKQRLKSQR